MALTLVEAAKLQQNELIRGVIETFTEASTVLDRLPFKNIQGNSYAYNVEATLPGVAFRGVNKTYTEATGTVNQLTETLKIMGGYADVDRFLEATQGNLSDQRAVQTAMMAKAIAYGYTNTFINGDATTSAAANSGQAPEFDGLKLRLTGAQVISAGDNGLEVLGDGSTTAINAFLDKLDQLLSLVSGINGSNGAIYCNASILSKIRSALRRLTMYQTTTDAVGRVQLVYNDIPVLDIGKTAAGAMILPQTETQGEHTETSSIYAVKFGDDVADGGVTGIQANTPTAYDLGELQTAPVYRTAIDWYCGLAVFNGKAAARLTGVING